MSRRNRGALHGWNGPVSVRCAVACLLFARVAVAGPQLIGVDTITDTLIRIDSTTGAGTAIGPVGDDIVAGLTYDAIHGVLLGSSTATNNLLRINPSTGSTSVIGALGVPLMHSIEFDSNSGVLYGITDLSSTRGLYTIDVGTGSATLIGIHGIAGLGGLGFDTVSHTMYACDILQRKFYALDLVTGAPTLIGSFGTGSLIGGGAAYDSVTGFMASDNHGGVISNSDLYRVETATGHASLVGSIGFENVISLAFVPESDIPEPSAIFLLSLGALSLLPRRRERR